MTSRTPALARLSTCAAQRLAAEGSIEKTERKFPELGDILAKVHRQQLFLVSLDKQDAMTEERKKRTIKNTETTMGRPEGTSKRHGRASPRKPKRPVN